MAARPRFPTCQSPQPGRHSVERLARRHIQAGNYFPPVHLQPFIAEEFGHKRRDFPIAESVSERTIALPFHNNLPMDQVEIVCKTLTELL